MIITKKERNQNILLLLQTLPLLSKQHWSWLIDVHVRLSNLKFASEFWILLTVTKKTGVDVVNLIIELSEHSIPLKDSRGQGYDNRSNMVGVYKDGQAIIMNITIWTFIKLCCT